MKHRPKYIYVILFFIIAAILSVLCLYIINAVKSSVKLISHDSFFNDFSVIEDKVYIKCHIVLRNDSNKEESVKLRANMEEDTSNGLLKSPIVYGYNRNGTDEFLVPANSTKGYSVSFIGDFAGNEEKLTRELPFIEIISQ